jgi:CHAD domain-containing protein
MARSSTSSGRWQVNAGELAPAGTVAVRTLRQRLDTVWTLLASAARDRAHDPEVVHQLRVSTRRAIAAIDAFRDLLPVRRAAWFGKQLRRIRRAAGEARDLDVLTNRLADDSSRPHGGKARARLVAMLSRQRAVSREPIRERHEKLLDADWPGRVAGLLEDVPKRRRHVSFGAYARRRFRPMIKHFFAVADRRLRDADEIHQLRIEGKKLRYAMEIFADVFPTRVRARCADSLERLQKTLGDFTDHATAADRFRRWAHDAAAAPQHETIERLRCAEEALADEARRRFSKWWSPARRRSLVRRFQRTLRRASA